MRLSEILNNSGMTRMTWQYR